MADRLDEYRRKRDAARTPEPVPPDAPQPGADNRFVIQQHHARALHWDLRLERDGVLVSWAVPRGLPRDQVRNHLAVHTEDHPMEYLSFHGEIPAGEYGGGRMSVFDTGTYETEKWRPDEVMVTLHGDRIEGRYVLFRTARPEPGKREEWMIRRMSPPADGWEPLPDLIRPSRPTPVDTLPEPDDEWAFEMRWEGTRAVAYVSGGRVRLMSMSDQDITGGYPAVRDIGAALAPTEAVLDGEVVAFDRQGRVRPAPTTTAGRRLPPGLVISYLVYDLLWLEGRRTVDLPYTQRRELLEGLALSGPAWQTPPSFRGGGQFALEAAAEQGLPGVIAKRLDSAYTPGRRTKDWLRIDN
ncbi:DNA polymerase ligase N-terminal domain-containing protein [Asanoa sp. NPDC049573]|uniref:DNA polymerase ligase N-terminal domain-containing protein n=1 Tax=Asanoa sp. NPDC049573 TaxID=3155396 RepID=UPI0034454705